ncbi:MAG: S-methyl-5'-thioadenosine phosphorylase [Nitrospirae bacterium]|nr:MAG: S-methyl-5'-thioadenosine phosphorylase [Nitrospirota bacterium]
MPKTSLRAQVAVIGGSGLYDMEGLTAIREVRPATPFGRPSDAIMVGILGERSVAFLARHGRGHRLSPTAINYRANIYALKALGVERIFSVSAVGSMKESIKPGDMVLPDQFIDLTRHRASTFFDQGVVAHVAFGDPVCRSLSSVLHHAAQQAGVPIHAGGTYLCIEGPQFSTKAESRLYRQWGVEVIGMTNMPEAKLAREAEICYATLALVTDYDCWHESEDAVSVEAILAIMHKNVAMAKQVLRLALERVPASRTCACATAMRQAIVTAPQAISGSLRRRLRLLLGGE